MESIQSPIKSLFQRSFKKSSPSSTSSPCSSSPCSPVENVTNPKNSLMNQLSPFANSVLARCSMILLISTGELQQRFEAELPDSVMHHLTYARNFIEFCSYQALHQLTKHPNYLSNKEFSRLSYDMMLAWETPGVESEELPQESASCSNQEGEDEDGWSLFYSSPTNTAVKVDENKTVGPEAFGRIAPVCASVADVITAQNLFDALTSSSGHRLHFLVYDKYLRSLDKVIKVAKNASGPPSVSNFQLAEGEIILDIDGTVPTQPVLQHIGISAWPGRLTLTNYALYFESFGVGLYDKAVRYDLALDMKQVVKPELTGPLGARLFDKAVMYKSTSILEPVYFEFPEFKGNSRRDYWLEMCLEILHAHTFMRKYNLRETQQSEVLARVIMGILRFRAVREAFHTFCSHYKTLLAFNLAESLPGGDSILETLSRHLDVLDASGAQCDLATGYARPQLTLSPVYLFTLHRHGFLLRKGVDIDGEGIFMGGDVCVGETSHLELAVKRSVGDTGRAEAAQATVDKVKVEGIDTNIAVMKELLFPVIELNRRFQLLASWEDPYKATAFLVLIGYAIFRDWIKYIVASMLLLLAVFMVWHRHFNKGKAIEVFRVNAPPNRNAVEQLLTLQETISQVEALIQAANIILLKMRAILFAVLPQATDRVCMFMVLVASLLVLMPLKHLAALMFVEAFTRQMPLRKYSTERWVRRVREWWFRIPAAPVQLVKPDDKKRK